MTDKIPRPSKGPRQKILSELRAELQEGIYAANQPLPSEQDLRTRFSTSRTTVRQALAELEHQSLIYRIQGKGTFARPPVETKIKPIALLLREPWKVTNIHNTELICGAQTAVSTAGSHLALISTTPGEWATELINSLAGVLVIPRLVTDNDLLTLKKMKVPYLMALESDLAGPTVRDNIEGAAYELTKGLLSLGHQRFALLSGHFEHSDRLKKRGIARALKEAGIEFNKIPDFCTNYDATVAREVCHEILQRNDRPTAIIGFDNALAIQAIRVAHTLGLQIPKDLSIAGFGGMDFSDTIDPPLTTVQLGGIEAGRRAVESLYAISQNNEAPQDIEVAHEIKWRCSTGSSPDHCQQ